MWTSPPRLIAPASYSHQWVRRIRAGYSLARSGLLLRKGLHADFTEGDDGAGVVILNPNVPCVGSCTSLRLVRLYLRRHRRDTVVVCYENAVYVNDRA